MLTWPKTCSLWRVQHAQGLAVAALQGQQWTVEGLPWLASLDAQESPEEKGMWLPPQEGVGAREWAGWGEP